MFGRKKKKIFEMDIQHAINDLRKAGYSKAEQDVMVLNRYYKTHDLYELEPELRITILMMYWLVNLYGDNEDKESMEQMRGQMFAKPQNSLYFYWIPSQFVRCRQLGGEIRCRQKGFHKGPTPEPTMKQDILEEKYIQTRDAIMMFKEVVNIPEKMENQFEKFTRTVDNILNIHSQETMIPETKHTIPLARPTEYKELNVKSMKPTFEDGSYTFTNYLNGEMSVEDYGKIGQMRGQTYGNK